jgi:hypothetical protein
MWRCFRSVVAHMKILARHAFMSRQPPGGAFPMDTAPTTVQVFRGLRERAGEFLILFVDRVRSNAHAQLHQRDR